MDFVPRKALAVLLLVPLLSCQRAERKAAAVHRTLSEPSLQAVVVTVQTTMQPSNRTLTHSITIAENRARSGDEVDTWRLFDFAKKQVTFVDDVTKTYRTVPFAVAIAQHRAAVAQPVRDDMPRAEIRVTGAVRPLQGVAARQTVIRLGAYQRELWVGAHPLIPPALFAMLTATSPVPTPLAGIARNVDEALLNVQGFPLADHAELPVDNKKLVVDSTVVKVEQRQVPLSWLRVRADYKDVTPRPNAPHE